MAVKRQREADELARNALSELRKPSDLSITQEERLTMRNIPFFVLPNHETVPKTDHIEAKVDTRNTSFTPASERSSSAPSYKARQSNKVPDYSHVKAKVYTGRKNSDKGQTHSLNTHSRSLPRSSRSTPSLHRFQTSLGRERSFLTSQLPARPLSASKYKDIKPRVNSFDNIHDLSSGGGNKKSVTAKAVTPTKQSPAKLAWERAGSPSETKSKPANTVKPREQVRSRIDQRDPNPAHKLKHTLEELTLSHGTTVNPRFAVEKKHISRRHSSADINTQKSKETGASKRTLRKSITLGGLKHSDSSPRFLKEIASRKDMESTRVSTVLQNGLVFGKKLANGETPSTNKAPLSSIVEDEQVLDNGSAATEDIEVSNTDTETTVFLKNIFAKSSLLHEDSKPVETGKMNKAPLGSIAEDVCTDGDIAVVDIEVNNTDSNTTVFLKNILAKSSLAQEDCAPTETKYYEVDEEENLLAAASSLSFPHGIPRVCVTDEEGELVEVIVDPPQTEQSNERLDQGGPAIYPLADDDQNLVEFVINSNNVGFNDDTSSTRL